MTKLFSRSVGTKLFLFAVLAVGAVGCAGTPADDEEAASSDAALEERWKVAEPTIVTIEKPLDLTFRPEWTESEMNEFEVRDPRGQWKTARTSRDMTFSDRPSTGSAIVDQLKNGFGSGPCRPKINPFKKEIGFKCTWRF